VRIDELLTQNHRPVFSFEFFPPKTEEGLRNLFEAVGELRHLRPDFVSVTYGAGGSTATKTIEIVSRIKEEYGIEAMPHFTCVGSTVEQLRDTLGAMAAAGIDNVLALRGDPPAGQDEWVKTDGGLEYSRELVELIRGGYPFSIGAACFPETHIHATSAEDDLYYLKDKVTPARSSSSRSCSSTTGCTSTSCAARATSASTCRSCRASCRSRTSSSSSG